MFSVFYISFSAGLVETAEVENIGNIIPVQVHGLVISSWPRQRFPMLHRLVPSYSNPEHNCFFHLRISGKGLSRLGSAVFSHSRLWKQRLDSLLSAPVSNNNLGLYCFSSWARLYVSTANLRNQRRIARRFHKPAPKFPLPRHHLPSNAFPARKTQWNLPEIGTNRPNFFLIAFKSSLLASTINPCPARV